MNLKEANVSFKFEFEGEVISILSGMLITKDEVKMDDDFRGFSGIRIIQDDDGSPIRQYENDNSNSFIVLTDACKRIRVGYTGVTIRTTVRRTFTRGKPWELVELIKSWILDGGIKGKIVTTEMVESDIPAGIDVTTREPKQDEDGSSFLCNGKEIYVFHTFYPEGMGGDEKDVLLKHDYDDNAVVRKPRKPFIPFSGDENMDSNPPV